MNSVEMTFPIKLEDDVVKVTSQDGEVEHSNVVATLSLFSNDPSRYWNKKLLIVDPMSNYNPSKQELQQFATMVNSLLTGVFFRIALVAPQDFHYGLGRMAEALAQPQKGQFRVFREEPEARSWLSS